MVTGTSIQSSKEALRLTRIFPNVLFSTAVRYCALIVSCDDVGIHPHDATSWDETSEEEIEFLCKNPECVPLGECGLDFSRNSPSEVQLEVFEKQVQMVVRLRKSVFLHERGAHAEMVLVLTNKDLFSFLTLHWNYRILCRLRMEGQESRWSAEATREYYSPGSLSSRNGCFVLVPKYPIAQTTRRCEAVNFSSVPDYPKSALHLSAERTLLTSSNSGDEIEIAELMNMPPEEVATATTYNAVKLFDLT
ncbi:unnamed protein product [Allacma fusca]|uniref:Uncharacterized protein n=1 Tax=Allacma fusca TaxID=39272 RepID=A0A8J2PEG2_9HEXA|nr:unnamed protein product [Allacma fusca]